MELGNCYRRTTGVILDRPRPGIGLYCKHNLFVWLIVPDRLLDQKLTVAQARCEGWACSSYTDDFSCRLGRIIIEPEIECGHLVDGQARTRTQRASGKLGNNSLLNDTWSCARSAGDK